MKFYRSLLIVLACALIALGQRTEPGSVAELAAITERGRNLYAYDLAAWHSTDAVLALKPIGGSVESYVAQRKGDKWTVVYGKLSPKRDAYLITYEATQGNLPNEFTVKKHDPTKEDKSFYLAAALAIDLVKADFGKADRPYNVAVLPASANQFYVYLLPAQTASGIFPLGGDVRYLMSTDGKKIVERRQLHKSIIEFQVPKDQIPQSGYHTAILDDIPEDTDVFHVLARQPSIPELIVTNKYVYQVKADGSIVYLMTRDAFFKIGKPSN